MSARQRAILGAMAAELHETAPALADHLAEGPELLRLRGVKPAALDGLVPECRRPPLRRRLRLRLRGTWPVRWMGPLGPTA